MITKLTIPATHGDILVEIHHKDGVSANYLIINYPGRRGSINGFNDKYAKIGETFEKTKEDGGANVTAAFVRMGNREVAGVDYADSVVDDLRDVYKFFKNEENRLEHFNEIIKPRAETWIAGTSAGGSAALEFSGEVTIGRLLLIAPSQNARNWAKGESHTGYTSILAGGLDDVVGSFPEFLSKQTTVGYESPRYHIEPEADHQFRGEHNGKVFSAAYTWAFSYSRRHTLDIEEGIILY